MRLCSSCGTSRTYNSRSVHCRACERSRIKTSSARAAKVRRQSLAYVADRDSYVCHLCRRVVDMTLPYPAPGFATLDHIVPISLGGSDNRTNLALAHLSCNVSRGNRDLPKVTGDIKIDRPHVDPAALNEVVRELPARIAATLTAMVPQRLGEDPHPWTS